MSRLEKADRNFSIAEVMIAAAGLFVALGRGRLRKERGRLKELEGDNDALLLDVQRLRIQLDGALADLHDQRPAPDPAVGDQRPDEGPALDGPGSTQGAPLDQPGGEPRPGLVSGIKWHDRLFVVGGTGSGKSELLNYSLPGVVCNHTVLLSGSGDRLNPIRSRRAQIAPVSAHCAAHQPGRLTSSPANPEDTPRVEPGPCKAGPSSGLWPPRRDPGPAFDHAGPRAHRRAGSAGAAHRAAARSYRPRVP